MDVSQPHLPDKIGSFTETTKFWEFDVKSIKYRMYVIERKNNDKLIYKIYFVNLTHSSTINRSNYSTDKEFEDAFDNAKMGITGTGNSLKVLSAVYNQLGQYIGENKPDYITFEAHEHNRNSLYKRLSDRFLKDLFKHKNLKYKEINIDPITDLTKKSTSFWFEKVI